MGKYYVESKYNGRYFHTLKDALSAMELLSQYHQYDFDKKKAEAELEKYGHFGIGFLSIHKVREGI